MKRYTDNHMSKHEIFDHSEHNANSTMGKVINAHKFSPQPGGEEQYAEISEDRFTGSNEETKPVDKIDLGTDRGLKNKLRPGSLLPNGDAE